MSANEEKPVPVVLRSEKPEKEIDAFSDFYRPEYRTGIEGEIVKYQTNFLKPVLDKDKLIEALKVLITDREENTGNFQKNFNFLLEGIDKGLFDVKADEVAELEERIAELELFTRDIPTASLKDIDVLLANSYLSTAASYLELFKKNKCEGWKRMTKYCITQAIRRAHISKGRGGEVMKWGKTRRSYEEGKQEISESKGGSSLGFLGSKK